MIKKELVYPVVVATAIITYVIATFPTFYPFPEMTTFLVTKMINLLDYTVADYKNNIIVNGFNAVSVSSECSGILILVAFALTIQVMPMFTIFQKVTALLFAPLIYIGNLFRICMSLLAGVEGSVPLMIFVHDTIGQIFLFFWAIFLYVVWLQMHSLFPTDTYRNNMHQRWHDRTYKEAKKKKNKK